MRNDLSVTRVLELMGEVRKYVNQYQAINIVYFACDDVDDKADAKYNEIMSAWKDASAGETDKRHR